MDRDTRGARKWEQREKKQRETVNVGQIDVWKNKWHGLKLRLRERVSGYNNPDFRFRADGTVLVGNPGGEDYQTTQLNLFQLLNDWRYDPAAYMPEQFIPTQWRAESSSSSDEEGDDGDNEEEG